MIYFFIKLCLTDLDFICFIIDNYFIGYYLFSDFCPDNILLDEGGCLLVTYESRWSCIDRQISVKNIDGSCTNVHYRDWITTGGYLAPELLSPLTNPTSAADWWSIGALLYHLLTGQVSFNLNSSKNK